ncbi:helix-turn-helix domain-containing protein [Priestia flexa]|uniref:helix-turn-helix domain-containing protein n=1 Tax=Priestia flexa TaxID=86664 RepID=UPI000473AA28|nr:helix-turn-helix transcriptional regulator [Priestia flexa]
MKIEIELKKETLIKLEEIARYETLQRKLRGKEDVVGIEDIFKAAVFDYLQKVYNFNQVKETYQLGSPYQLKNKFKKIMDQEGLKSKDLANLTGIDPGAFSRILNNKTQPSLDYFVRICVALQRYDMFSVLYKEK